MKKIKLIMAVLLNISLCTIPTQSHAGFFSALKDLIFSSEEARSFLAIVAGNIVGAYISFKMTTHLIAKKFQPTKPTTTFDQIRGKTPKEIQAIFHKIEHPEIYKKLSRSNLTSKSILLDGPPGVGKTEVARAIANKLGAYFFEISAAELDSMWVSGNTSNIQSLFASARSHVIKRSSYSRWPWNVLCPQPKDIQVVVFIDEIEAIGKSREKVSEHSAKGVATLLTEMSKKEDNEHILIVAATNYKDVLDPALTRSKRFSTHVTIDLPDNQKRLEILKHYGAQHTLDHNINLQQLATLTDGFNCADLEEIFIRAVEYAGLTGQNTVTQQNCIDSIQAIGKSKPKKSKKLHKKQEECPALQPYQVLQPIMDSILSINNRNYTPNNSINFPAAERRGIVIF